MKTYTLNKGVTIRSLVLGLTPATVDEFLVELNNRKQNEVRISQTKGKFEALVSEWGWNSPKEFLTDLGYLGNQTIERSPSKGVRSRMSADQRTQIVERLKSGVKSTDEIAAEFGISNDLVYSIKSKAGLTAKRKPKATSALPVPNANLPKMEVAA